MACGVGKLDILDHCAAGTYIMYENLVIHLAPGTEFFKKCKLTLTERKNRAD